MRAVSVHTFHCRFWLDVLISVPCLQRPLCAPCFQPAFPCLPIPPSKTSCPSPWQCPPLPLALASSHSAQTLTPPLSPSLAHSPGSLSSLRSQPSDRNPLHLLPPPELLLSLTHLCQLLSSFTAPLPTALQPCRSLLGFYKPCHHPFPL